MHVNPPDLSFLLFYEAYLQLQANLYMFLYVPEKEHNDRRSRTIRCGSFSIHMPVNKFTGRIQHALYNDVQSESVSDTDLVQFVQHLEDFLESVSQLKSSGAI